MINPSGTHNKLFLAAAFFTGCFFVLSCENDEKVVREMTETKVMTEEAKNIESYLSQDGVMRAKLKAPLMLRVLGDTLYIEFPQSLHIDFFDTAATVESWVDAKYGKYYENLNKAYLRDSVIVINNQGDTIKCLDLWWDQNTKLFYTDKLAHYLTKDNHISASQGLEATQDFRRVTFNKLLYSTVRVSENGFPK